MLKKLLVVLVRKAVQFFAQVAAIKVVRLAGCCLYPYDVRVQLP